MFLPTRMGGVSGRAQFARTTPHDATSDVTNTYCTENTGSTMVQGTDQTQEISALIGRPHTHTQYVS